MTRVGKGKVEEKVVRVVWHTERSQSRIEREIWVKRRAGREREW
mgnify:FL=1